MDPKRKSLNSQKQLSINNTKEFNPFSYRQNYISELSTSENVFLYGYASKPDTTASVLSNMSEINGWVGIGTSLTETCVKKTTVRLFKSKMFSPKYYTSGWGGGSPSKIKTYKVSSLASHAGKINLFLGIIIDLERLKKGDISPAKFIVNTTVGVGCCLIGGVPGVACYVIYFVLDSAGVIDKVIDYASELLKNTGNNLSTFSTPSTGLSISPLTSKNIPVYYTTRKLHIAY